MFRRFLPFLTILLVSASVPALAAVPPSTINLSVEATTADIGAIVNKSLPAQLYKGEGGLGTSVTVVRTGPAVVTAADNFIHLALPVQLTFSYAMYESRPLRGELRFKARLAVTPDWRLKTELYYTGLSDNLADSFSIGPISLKPKSTVEALAQPVQRLLAPIVDAKVNDAVKLRERVAPVWQQAFTPVLVSKEFGAWLRLTPDRIVMSPLLAANNRLRLSIGLITGAEVTVGPRPEAALARPLPPLQQVPSFDRRFNVHLAADIVYDQLVAALKPVLLDKTFGTERKVTVKGFSLRGEEGRLKVVLATTGDFDGELTLLAKPVHNVQTNRLTFEEVDFDTRNAGWLTTTGSWLFSSAIRETIKSKLDAAVVERLETARLKASTALSSVQAGDHVKLTGAVTALSLGDVAVLADRMTVQVVTQGETSVSLK